MTKYFSIALFFLIFFLIATEFLNSEQINNVNTDFSKSSIIQEKYTEFINIGYDTKDFEYSLYFGMSLNEYNRYYHKRQSKKLRIGSGVLLGFSSASLVPSFALGVFIANGFDDLAPLASISVLLPFSAITMVSGALVLKKSYHYMKNKDYLKKKLEFRLTPDTLSLIF